MHHVNSYAYLKGFSLIELMLALSLSAIGFTILIKLFSTVLVSDSNMEKYYMVHDGGNNLLAILQRDLARAGFMQRDISSMIKVNPFVYTDNKLFHLNAEKNCITYRYDRDKNGVLNNEYYGFRLFNQTIKRSKGSVINCDDMTGWESISDTRNLKVTQLKFSLNNNERKLGEVTKTYIEVELQLEHQLLPDSSLSFKRNLMTSVAL